MAAKVSLRLTPEEFRTELTSSRCVETITITMIITIIITIIIIITVIITI